MAEMKPAKAETAKPARSEMSMAQNAIAFVVAGVIAAAVGAFAGTQAKPADSPPIDKGREGFHPQSSGTAAAPEKKASPISDMGVLDLQPIVTNLAAPPDVWVRVEGALLFEGKTLPHGEALAGQISADLLAFMRTQTLQQLQGVSGLQHLRQDLNERVATRSQGQVREFIIKTLVIQ